MMVAGRDETAIPTVTGQYQQVFEQFDGFGGDGEVHLAGSGHFRDLHRRSLVYLQGDRRVMFTENLDHPGQGITGLGMGGGDRQGTAAVVAILGGQGLNITDLAQDAFGFFHNLPANRSEVGQVFAVTAE